MAKKNFKFFLQLFSAIILTFGLTVSLQSLLAAWNAPTLAPPNGNVEMPIYSASTGGQTINSDLSLGASYIIDSDYVTAWNYLLSNAIYGIGHAIPATVENIILGDTTDNIRVTGSICIDNECQSSWGQYGDNLGNHTATTNIKLGTSTAVGFTGMSHWLSRDGDREGIGISWNGNVGVGTNSPSSLLHLFKTTNGTPNAEIAIQSVNGLNSHWAIYQQRDDVIATGGYNEASDLRFWNNTPIAMADKNIMTLSDGGNVGIGITTPMTKLVVYGGDDNTNGQLRVESSANDARISLYNANGSSATGRGDILMSRTTNFEGMRFMTNNTDRMIIDESGNVGIGNASPGGKLDVSGNVVVSGSSVIIDRPNTSGGWARGVFYYPTDTYSGTDLGAVGMYGSDTTVNSMFMSIGDDPWSNANGIHLLASGNVGIGKTGPSYKLDVNGDANATRLCIAGICQANWGSITGDNLGNHTATENIGLADYWLSNRVVNNNGIRINDAGNVGIGLSNPDAILTIAAPNAGVDQIRLRSARAAIVANNIIGGINMMSNDTSLTAPGIQVASIQGAASQTHTAAALGTSLIFNVTANNTIAPFEAMRILQSGNVGIGTAGPSGKLNVAGNIRAGAVTEDNGSVAGYGDYVDFSGGDDWAAFNSDNSDPLWIARYNAASDQSQLRINIGDGSDANDQLRVITTGNEQILVARADGNVGIGTAVPKSLLHLAAADESTKSALSIRQSNSDTYGFDFSLDQTVNGDLYLDRVNADVKANVMTFSRSTGNVGIQRTPNYQLDVNGNANANQLCISGDCRPSWGAAGDNLGNHTATGNIKLNGFWLSNDGDGEGVFVDTSGNVITNTAMYSPYFYDRDDGNYYANPNGTSRLNQVSVGSADLGGTAHSLILKTNAGSLGAAAGSELSLASFGFTSSNESALGIRAWRSANGSDWTTTAIGMGMDVDNTVRVNGSAIWLGANANVGIGTTPNPSWKLDVRGNIGGGGGLFVHSSPYSALIQNSAYISNFAYLGFDYGANGRYGVYAVGETAALAGFYSGGTHIGYVGHSAWGVWASSYGGGGCDIAEKYAVSSQESVQLEPGDILAIDTEESLAIKKSRRAYETNVIGVYSTNPNLTMGAKEDSSNKDDPPVALLGRVPTKVTAENGPIKIGDMIVTSSKPGYGMRCEIREIGAETTWEEGRVIMALNEKCRNAAVGRALENLDNGEGKIEVLMKGGN